jgi:hypothetical protein
MSNETVVQGMTVSLNLSGIQKICADTVGKTITDALNQLAVGTVTVPIPDFKVSDGDFGSEEYSNVNIHLESGTVSGLDMVFGTISQDTGGKGQFTLPFSSGNFDVNFTDWNESYHEFISSYAPVSRDCPGGGGCPQTDFGPFSFSMSLSVTEQVTIGYDPDSNDWTITPGAPQATPTVNQLVIPSNSVLTQTSVCSSANPVADQVDDSIENAIDWKTKVTNALKDVAATIPASGDLGDGVRLGFALGTTGITYPTGGTGMSFGATGLATFGQHSYEGPGPSVALPVPPIPAGTDAVYNVSDYVFNGLFWTYYTAGAIRYMFTPDDLPDPSALKTDTYQGTNLAILYNRYGSTSMNAEIAATAAPSVSFQSIWTVTHDTIAGVAGLPEADSSSILNSLAGNVYTDEGAFRQAVVAAIGASDTTQWFPEISTACSSVAAVCKLPMTVTIQVFNTDTKVFDTAFELSVVLDFSLANLSLGANLKNTTESLLYDVHLIPPMAGDPGPTLLSSEFPSINAGDVSSIWVPTLRAEVIDELALFGQQGIPLPRVANVSFPSGTETITISQGYVTVNTNLT